MLSDEDVVVVVDEDVVVVVDVVVISNAQYQKTKICL